MEQAIMISFRPDDFETWLELHTETEPLRREYGITEGPHYRDPNDPGALLVRMDVEDLDRAMECLRSDVMRETVKRMPVRDAEFWIAQKRTGRAHFVSEREAELLSKERAARERELADQKHYLPRQLPVLQGWQVAAYYQPASSIGGDFYDFIELPEGQLGLVVGDVTDKGIPAAMLMAGTRSVLRASAQRLVSPGAVLERVNEQLCPDMPEKMFVTCLYAVLDPSTGRLRYANAGHNLPCVQTEKGAIELHATGMPLGLLPGMSYEEEEAVLNPGETILFSTGGWAEAHGPTGELFGCPRLMELVGGAAGGTSELIDRILTELNRFTGEDLEQEDDITLVSVQRAPSAKGLGERRMQSRFTIPSQRGNERLAIERLTAIVAGLELPLRGWSG